MTSSPRPVIVWGNCQAAPLASLISEPLRAHGWQIEVVPPVFEIDETGLGRVQEMLPSAAALITQPVRDEYRIPGCGSSQLAERLSGDAKLVTIPNTYDGSAFPYQVNAHRGDGSRIDAPLTDYHDLRAIVAAERHYSVDEALEWWPQPTEAMVTTIAERSLAEIRRRESELDVHVSDLLGGPAMFTLSHPTNQTLAEIARRILGTLELETDIVIPEREFLGARRAPVEASVVDALDWPGQARRDDWVINGRATPLAEILQAQLPFYADRPDIAEDARVRFADKLALLDLGPDPTPEP